MHDAYKTINYYNPDKEHKILIVFNDMIADMIHHKKIDSIVTELFIRGRKQYHKKLNSIVTILFIRGRKLYIFLIFITQSYFKVPKEVRLNTTHFFISKNSK